MKNFVTNQPVDAIAGAMANSARKIFVEYGLVYDINREDWVAGMVLHVGNSSITVTEPQAERLSEEIDGKFLSDRFDAMLESSIERHPAGKMRESYE